MPRQSPARHFVNDDRGATIVVFAAILAVSILLVAGAVDFMAAHQRRTDLNTAADAALLAALKTASDQSKAAGGGGGDDNDDSDGYLEAALDAGRKAFAANLAGRSDVSVDVPDIEIEHNGNTFSGKLTYHGRYRTKFLPIGQISALDLSSTVEAIIGTPNFLDIHLLVDVSPSMGIGATLADQQLVQNATGCAIACHYYHPDIGGSRFDEARATGAMLRIDIVREAVEDFIEEMRDTAPEADSVRISIDLFSSRVIPLLAPSTDLDEALAAARTIELTDTLPNGGTNIAASLAELEAGLPAAGTGSTSGDRRSYVVLITDGIENSNYSLPSGTPGRASDDITDPAFVHTSPSQVSWGYQHIQAPEAAICDAVKRNGRTLLTAQVEYLIPPAWDASSEPRFDFIETELKAKSTAELAKCASDPSLAFYASTSADVLNMLQEISRTILNPSELRLTR